MRLFVAIDISEELRAELAKLEDELEERGSAPSLKLVDPENIHLTLKFLGEVHDEKLPQVKDALSKVKFSDVKLATTKIGTFPRVLWLGVKLTKELAQLQREVARAVRPFTTHDPRPFKPHLTIARFEGLTEEERAALDAVIRERKINQRWKSASFVLYRSTLTPRGPVYEALARYTA